LSAHRRAAGVAARVRAWHERMLTTAEEGPGYGTRWGRGAAALVPAGAAVTAIGAAVSNGVLAANFNVVNQKFTLNVAQLDGTGLGAVLAAARTGASGDAPGVLHAGLASAKLSGTCILVHQSLLGVPYTITIGALGATPSNGTNLYFDVTDLTATPATLSGAILGESADAVTVNSTPLGGAPGGFGLDLSRGTVTLRNVVASAYQTQVVGALTLPDLGIHVKLGNSNGC
jgi:hypothetical protein